MEILSVVVEKVLEYTVVPVGRQLGYVIFYNDNIERLKMEAENLNAARTDVGRKVVTAQNNNEEIKEIVEVWMRDVDEIIAKGKKFFEEESQANTVCSLRSCPNLWLRYKLSRKAKKMAAKVDKYNGDVVEKCGYVSTGRKLPPCCWDTSTTTEAFESRVSTIKEIMEALIDPAVHLIGLYGLGGVGKTTLAKQVAEKAQDEKLFDRVLVVEVKHNPINGIQNQIADMVGFHFDAQSENRRADELRQRLEQEKSLLIVLDDLWERLDFKQVGIPSADDPNTQRKFIFTSRDARLLSGQMNCKRNILLGLLSEEEAWVLFKKMAEINEHSDDSDLVSKAKEVSQKCAQLPVAIVVVARALRNDKSLEYWTDALQRLKGYSSRNILTGEVDSSIRLSYDILEKKELKPAFLLSTMLSQDALVEDLFMYAVGLGYLEDVHSVKGARIRVEALVHRLKALSLLLDSYSKDRFTIHDVVRDVVLSIAVGEQHALVKRCEKVDEWPNVEQLEECIFICLDRSDINELPEELYGPKVEFFYFANKDRKLSMPSNFFRRMQELKVLSLSNMTFSSLPSSISLLKKLATLSIHYCTLEDISVVENLKNLKILNLSSSRIEELPCEVGQLSSLKILNLSRCYQLKVIPSNLLSNLKKLEELYMERSFNQWKAKGLNEGEDKASLDELKNLQKLSALEIDIPNASVLPKDLFLENLLERYKISVGECCRDYYSYEFSRTLRLVANSNINMEYGVFRLFESVEDLYLQNLNGVASLYQNQITGQTFCKLRAIKVSRCDQLKFLFTVSVAETLSKLETIEVSECKSLQEIVAFSVEENVVKGSTMNFIEFLQLRSLKLKDLPALTDFCFNKKVSFPNLETLHVKSVNCQWIWVSEFVESSQWVSEIVESSQIRIVSNDPLQGRSFGNLKTLVIVNCKFLLKLIPLYILKSLSNLEKLEISGCDLLEEVFDFGQFNNCKETHTINSQISYCETEFVVANELPLERDTIVLPKLRKLEIEDCNNLKLFQSELSDTKYSLFLDEKVIPKLDELSLIGMHAKMMWNGEFRGLCFLNVKFLSLSEIYDKTGTFPYSLFHGFPNLEELQLCSIWSQVIFSCSERSLDNDAQKPMSIKGLKLSLMSRLKHIWDGKCQMDHILQNLETLYVEQCNSLINLGSSFVSLKNLTDLNVSSCGELINLLTLSTARTLVQLTRLKIERCEKIEEIITDGEEDEKKDIIFMKLKILELDGLSSCSSFCCHSYNFEFSILDEVIIRECPRLRMFCPGSVVTPLLKGVVTPLHRGVMVADEKIHWQSNLNITIQQLFDQKVLFTGLPVKIDEYPELIEIWNGKCAVSNPTFSNLTYLIMDKCAFLSKYVIPSLVLISLINLEQLEVMNCESVEVVFDLEGIDIDKEAHTLQAIPLWRLKLQHLPNLKCVWNKDPHTVHCFQYLRYMSAYECESLRSIFPASIAKGLINLSRLEVESCGVEVIVAEDHTPSPTIHFVFHVLWKLHLIKLPNLKNFYPQRHTVEWPRLGYMDVRQCKKMKVFSWEDPKITEKETQDGVENQYPLFLLEKVTFPNLETLHLASIHCHSIWDTWMSKSSEIQIPEIVESSQIRVVSKDPLPDGCFSNLKTLVVVDCKFLLKFMPLYILKSLNHLEALEISGCDLLEEIFHFGPFNNYGEAHTSRLKRLILRSLSKLKTVWGRGSEGIVNFSSLQQVDVRECRSLESVFPASIAKGLIQLDELLISDCRIEVVVAEDEFSLEADFAFVFPEFRKLEIKNCNKLKKFQSELPDAKYSLCLDEKVTFPKLEALRLASIPCQSIWDICMSESSEIQILKIVESSQIRAVSRDPLSDGSFSNLKTLEVVDCKFLLKFMPLYILKSLSNLEELEISGCDLLEEVFHFGRFKNYEEAHTCRLKRLIFKSLSKLKTVWGRGSQGIVNFSSLQQMNVRECRSLESVFPASIAKSLIQLEELQISDCGIEVVVAEDEFPLEADVTFVFPKFQKLEIENCNKLKIFQSELSDAKYSLFLDEKVMPKLEELSLIGMHAKMMWNGEFRGFYFLNVKFLSLSEIYGKTGTFPYSLFHGFPNLEQLQLCSTSSEVIFSCSERSLENDAQKTISIKRLMLSSMRRVKHIWDGKCQVDHILQNLETLYVDSCDRLINLGSSFVYLQNLTDLDVSYCDGLINLLAPSTARTLVQLTRLRMERCEKIEEIITDGEEDEGREVVFMKLKILELDGLSSCRSFCCHSYNFEFPILDEVIIRGCPSLRMFCPGSVITPLLKGVKVADEEMHWQSNLNITIQQLFNQKILFTGEDVKIDEYPELIDIWNEKCTVSNPSFSNLTSLIIDKCAFLSKYVIPSHVLMSLINLKELKVRNCESVEVVFDLEGINIDKEAHTLQAIPLWRLELQHLPNLKCVWNKDPHTVHCFQNLGFMSAYECENLRSIFPASIAEGLMNLSSLKIESCGVQVIVAEDRTPSPTIHFVFPEQWELHLVRLPNLKNFYPQRHTVEWPGLRRMDVRQCKKLKVFSWDDPKITEKETEDGVENQYPLFLLEKVFSKLYHVVLNQDHVKMLRNDQFQYDFFNEVRGLDLDSFNEDEPLVFPCVVLEKFPELKYLNVSHSSFKDIFACHGPPSDPSRKLPLLTSLSLEHLDQLQNIWNKDSNTCPVLQSLKRLDINHCYRLINLAPSSASFDNLSWLTVSSCHHLCYLLTTSTTKSLVHLQRLKIKDCEKMEEIVTNEGKDLEDIIRLGELKAMKLIDLPVLKNFCSQTCTFEFPSLTDVTIRGCSKMKMFCLGVLVTPLLEDVKVEDDKERWEGNLNETLEQLFLEKEGQNSLEG